MTSPAKPPDQFGMRSALLGLGEQMQNAVASAAETSQQIRSQIGAQISTADVSGVVLTGMGGSGIAGDIAQAIGGPISPVPITVVKGYECPAFVGPGTLVLALSFSGNTEETLSVALAAKESGASVIAITSGGELARLSQQWASADGASADGASSSSARYPVDAGIPMPRAAVGALAVPTLLALEAAGLLDGATAQVESAIAQVNTRIESLPTDGAPASNAPASNALEHLPLVCGAGNLGTAAALRWKAQINENTKLPAMLGEMPELCHNQLAGWEVSPELAHQVQPYFLRHDYEHRQNAKRFEYYADVLAKASVLPPIEVKASGSTPLAQLFDLIVVGDDLSLRLAAALGRDPGPVDILMNLKTYLAK